MATPNKTVPHWEWIFQSSKINSLFSINSELRLPVDLVGSTTPLCWTELSEKKIISPDLIQETKEKLKMIRERLKVATDRQKSYADMRRKDIQYEIDEKVFLKVSP